MSVFPDWKKFAVPQKEWRTGCIPTGYEMILRAAEAQNIDYTDFQKDFDLDYGKTTPPWSNNFGTVAAKIRERYSNVEFAEKPFPQGKGAEKLRFIEEHLANKRPILVSIANEAFGNSGWHIMPVVDMDADTLTLLKELKPDGTPDLLRLAKQEMVRIHDNYSGGWEVAYLKCC